MGKESGEEKNVFRARSQQLGNMLNEKFKTGDFKFYEGSNATDEGMITLLGRKEKDGKEIPYMIFFKDGLVTEQYVSHFHGS